jgi:hypothetical protein
MRSPSVLRNSAIKAALIRGGLSFLLLGGLVNGSGAQELSIDDLFAVPSAEPANNQPLVTFEQLEPSAIPALWPRLEDELKRGSSAVVLATTEVLLAWLPPDTPEYGEALFFRAKGFAATDDLDRVDRIATVYLRSFPRGPRVGWFLIQVARGWSRDGRSTEAANAWAAILDEKLALEPREALEAATVMDQAFRPVDVRRALAKAGDLASSAEGQRLLLRSLILQDDPSFQAPAPQMGADAGLILLHAALAEVRGQRQEAVNLYRTVATESSSATAPQKEFARRRIEDRWRPWPPPAPVNSTSR